MNELDVKTTYLKQKITAELQNRIGNREGIEILTDYVWHMITQPGTTRDSVISELKDFLLDETADFVNWLINEIGPILINNDKMPGNREQQNNAYNAQYQTYNPNNESFSNNNQIPNDNNETFDDMIAQKTEELQTKNTIRKPKHTNYQRKVPKIPISTVSHIMNTLTDPDRPHIFIDKETRIPLTLVPLNAAADTVKKFKKKCSKFPECKLGDNCRYIHPAEMCKNWPKCPFTSECFYIHPTVECKYAINCLNSMCNYQHPPNWNPKSNQSRFNTHTGLYKNLKYTASD